MGNALLVLLVIGLTLFNRSVLDSVYDWNSFPLWALAFNMAACQTIAIQVIAIQVKGMRAARD